MGYTRVYRIGYPSKRVSHKRYEINLLGDPALVHRGQRTALNAPLLRLAAAFPGPIRRDEFIASLYPDVDLDQARNRFRVALTRIRKAIPIVELEDRMVLDPDQVRVDLARLRLQIAESLAEPDALAESSALQAMLSQLADLAERATDHATCAAAAEA